LSSIIAPMMSMVPFCANDCDMAHHLRVGEQRTGLRPQDRHIVGPFWCASYHIADQRCDDLLHLLPPGATGHRNNFWEVKSGYSKVGTAADDANRNATRARATSNMCWKGDKSIRVLVARLLLLHYNVGHGRR
jgi:hypothetical protein